MSEENDDIDIKVAKRVLLMVYCDKKLTESELVERGGLKLMNRVHTAILETVNRI
ncbi:MAG: hypothetical protein LBL41_03055 [Bifidobacteriaceae bacterium]|jgi:hypothetical protein|nr:hypothetical protein [Bifidobacteriaceae bacterium]